MEGRLMLSTTTDADFMPLDLTVAQFSLDSMDAAPGAKYTIVDAAGHQGGFIETPYSSGFISSDSTFGTPLQLNPRGAEPNVDPQLPTIPTRSDTHVLAPSTPAEPALNIQDNVGSPLDSSLGTTTEVFVNEPQVDGFELQPSVIPIWEMLPQGPSFDSSFVRFRPEAFPAEGGLIQIESVLTSMASLVGPELSDVFADTSIGNDPEEVEEPIRLAATATSDGGAISGELARAITFEMAGGEPDDTEPAARAARRDASQTPDGNTRPISREPVSEAGQRAQSVVGRVAAAGVPQAEMAPAQTSPALETLGGMVAGVTPAAHPVFERTVGWTPVSTIAPIGAVPGETAALDFAHMEAFEELADEAATRSSLGLEFSLRGALNATPLLMILALERIAANNSRRANRDERTPTSLSLRQLKQ
jgi:hypothetical protein